MSHSVVQNQSSVHNSSSNSTENNPDATATTLNDDQTNFTPRWCRIQTALSTNGFSSSSRRSMNFPVGNQQLTAALHPHNHKLTQSLTSEQSSDALWCTFVLTKFAAFFVVTDLLTVPASSLCCRYWYVWLIDSRTHSFGSFGTVKKFALLLFSVPGHWNVLRAIGFTLRNDWAGVCDRLENLL